MADTINAQVLFFARSRELAGVSSVKLQVPVETTPKELLSLISAAYPALLPLVDSAAIAVNEEFKSSATALTLSSGDVVAVIPPISGG
ncbi:hypothetical protein SARC_03873 [Sphaeroforma arctica JP610]|uniref:Molybdopterin synthase sulfur carrier subunit n=1 Tax=Sphaeroforma arctica JP610 TaxID=667725 RepID=A0A0L0G6M0_9EUKA|nr:hypothetical protein SARC_03873 [Sphaeroforma arctica JP610]KNC83883.1 hypothetical protein SARC_03873 [Sphaeroforma arctica JP610]|eukprot:XP_014157785.1 hypothetical protein SARC_03873 [Sphaeroforma arctica JP610]